MGGGREQASANRGYLRFSIDLPNVKFELETASPDKALPEVRRIIEALNADAAEPFDLRSNLTEEFAGHAPLVERVQNALVLDEEVKVLKNVLAFDEEYDLETGQQTRQLETTHVKQAMTQLFAEAPAAVRDCMVHLRGDLSKEQQHVLMDAIRQRLGVAVQPRFFCTRKNLEGKVLVEAVCFGAHA